jgi:hypothetical protein
MSTKEMKEIRAAKAKVKYQADPKTEQLRKFLFRVSKGVTPTLLSMKKYGYTLDAVNLIRDEAGFDPIENHSLKGYKREQMNLMITDTNEVLKSVIPNVHVFESMKKSANSDKPVTVQHMDLNSTITLDFYLDCLRNKTDVSESTVKSYASRLRVLLRKLGWKKQNESIVPYLKDFDHVKGVIETMKNSKKGQTHNLIKQSTMKSTFQSISTGLYKNGCPAFAHQMGPDAIQKYTTETSDYTTDNLEDRIDKVQNKDYVRWEEILKVASKYINDPKTSLSDKVYMQIHTGLGAAPRTGTFLKMHVVDTIADTEDLTKNYYVKDTQTMIANVHKTGVAKKNGATIVQSLAKYPAIAKNIKQLAEEKDILFNYEYNRASPKFKKLFGKDKDKDSINNQYLRHSNTHWRIRMNDPVITAQALRINAHTDKTARSVYAKRKRTILAEEAAKINPVVVTKKKAVVAPKQPKKVVVVKPVVEPVVVRKKTRADAISNIVKAMKPAPMKAVVIQEIPISKNRRSQRNK